VVVLPLYLQIYLEWNGIFWVQRQNMGSKARYRLSMAYDSNRDRTIVRGGLKADTNFGDTWEIKIETVPERHHSKEVEIDLWLGFEPLGHTWGV
jgi:hypothetical protein